MRDPACIFHAVVLWLSTQPTEKTSQNSMVRFAINAYTRRYLKWFRTWMYAFQHPQADNLWVYASGQ